MFESEKRDGKTANQEDSLRNGKPLKVGISFDVQDFQPGHPLFQCLLSVLVRFVLDTVVSRKFTSVHAIHEDITLGS